MFISSSDLWSSLIRTRVAVALPNKFKAVLGPGQPSILRQLRSLNTYINYCTRSNIFALYELHVMLIALMICTDFVVSAASTPSDDWRSLASTCRQRFLVGKNCNPIKELWDAMEIKAQQPTDCIMMQSVQTLTNKPGKWRQWQTNLILGSVHKKWQKGLQEDEIAKSNTDCQIFHHLFILLEVETVAEWWWMRSQQMTSPCFQYTQLSEMWLLKLLLGRIKKQAVSLSPGFHDIEVTYQPHSVVYPWI